MGVPLVYYYSFYGAAITISGTRGLLAFATFICAKIAQKKEGLTKTAPNKCNDSLF